MSENWIEISFTDFLDIQGGTQPPKSEFISTEEDGYVRLLQIRDFGEKPVPTYIPDKSKLKKCKEDDVLIARYGASVGRILTGMKGAYNVAIAKVVIPELVDKRYIFHLLNTNIFQEPITSFQRSAQNGFNKDDLETIRIPLAPLNEQKRIAQQLDAIFEKINQNKARLERIPQLLKDFRQQVLESIITENCTPVRLEKLLSDLKYGTSAKGFKEKVGIPVLRIPNMDGLGISFSDLKYSSLNENEIEKYRLQREDVLMIRSNGSVGLLGQTSIVEELPEPMVYAGYLIRLRLKSDVLSPKLFNYIMRTQVVRSQIEMPARSTSGVHNINSKEVKSLSIPVPPFEQQEKIVDRIEELFEMADSLEKHYNQAKIKIERLPQAILAKAFRGELVEQDPNDEPASELLKKIKEAKKALKKKKK